MDLLVRWRRTLLRSGLGRWLVRLCWGWGSHLRLHFGARRRVGYGRHMSDMSGDGIVQFNVVVVEGQASSAIQFHPRLYVGRVGADQVRLGLGQAGLVLQDQGGGRSSKSVLLLLGVKRLSGQ